MAAQGKKWMQNLKIKKGALRSKLGAKNGQPIPKTKLDKATKSKNPLEKKEAVLAETFRKAK